MIDFRERLTILHMLLDQRYEMKDVQAADILLAARLPQPSAPPAIILPFPWIVLETGFYSRDVYSTHPWFVFGADERREIERTVHSYPAIRSSALSRQGEVRTIQIPAAANNLNRNAALVLVEPDWETPWHPGRGRHRGSVAWAHALDQYCIRVRTPYPKANLLKDRDVTEVGAAARDVLDVRFRNPPPRPEPVPKGLLWWLEIVQKISERQNSWEELLRNLSALRSRLAWLRVKKEPDAEEDRDLERVVRDMVPHVWRALLMQLAGNGKVRRDIRVPIDEVHRQTWLQHELGRLAATGVIESWREPGKTNLDIKWRVVNQEVLKLCQYETRLI